MNKVREGYKITEIGDIPIEWEVRYLEDVCEILDSYRKPIKASDREEMKGDIPYYGASGVIDWINDFIFDEELILLGEDGENLNSRNTDLAFKISGKSWVNNHAHVFRIANKNRDNIDFMVYYLESKDYSRYIAGSAQPKITQAQCRKFLLPSPDLKEQEKIASILSTVDEQIDNVDALIEKNKELKKGLMQTLLTKGIGHTKFKKTEIGEIPSEWDIKSIDEITKEVYRYPTYYGIEYVEEGIAEIRGELLNDDASIKKESFRYISEKTAKKFPRTKLEVGDIVISVRGTIGKVGYITEELAGSNITANLLRVSMNRNIMNEHFIKQLFLSDIMKRKFDEITTATTIKTFKVPEFKQIILAIPTKDEQDKIASILLEVDKKIEEHENKKQKLENLKKGLMQQLLTGKIRTI